MSNERDTTSPAEESLEKAIGSRRRLMESLRVTDTAKLKGPVDGDAPPDDAGAPDEGGPTAPDE